MVSLPTAAKSGAYIRSFYAAHSQVVVVQQVLSVLILPPLIAFVLGLRAQLGGGQGLTLGAALVVLAELCTNVPPLILAATNLSSDTAHALTVVEDAADAALFASTGVFSATVAISARSWLRVVAVVAALLAFVRAAATPVHAQILDISAPLAFLALVLASSVWMMVLRRQPEPL
jgi:hypothetical protein